MRAKRTSLVHIIYFSRLTLSADLAKRSAQIDDITRVAQKKNEFAVITSDNPRTEDPMTIIDSIEEGMKRSGTKYTVIENRKEAIRYALASAQTDDVIMIAGKGHENYQEINGTKYHFDDKEIVEELLNEL